MKLIDSKAELILQQGGLEGVYKQIEFCGRTCYKSEDKITEDSAKGFVDRMIKSNHTAMLEQGTVYLMAIDWDYNPLRHYWTNKYSRVKEIHLETEHCQSDTSYKYAYYVTTNLRVLVENGWLDDLQYLCDPTEHHEKRYTMKFTTDRGVSHELVRHRVFSFAQESTRYCNYSKDKFGNELTFIKPSWYDKDEHTTWLFNGQIGASETAYLLLLEKGCSPQEARQILPNALKTEICMTGFACHWRFFFDLRYFGKTGKPHPDMELLATKAKTEFMRAGLWKEIMVQPSKFDKNDSKG